MLAFSINALTSRKTAAMIDNEMYEWRWDGVTIEGIKAFAAKHNLSLLDLAEYYFCAGWPDSIPEDYQGLISGAKIDDPSKGENSLAGIKQLLRILAFDKDGKALVMRGVVDLYSDGEGYEVIETTAIEALVLADKYRAATSSRNEAQV